MEITIPYRYTPRAYQLPILKALDKGIKRAIWVVHRRGGKDKTMWNYMIKQAVQQKGIYYYFLPTYKQAKKIIWDGIDKDGFRFLDHLPQEIVDGKPNDTELKIKLINGSVIQLIGSDSYNSIVGTNPRGCVFSEYALQDPLAWEYIRPILTENGGWAVFISTPRGENHLYELIENNKDNPEWFVEILDIKKTGVISESQIMAEKRAGMSEDLIDQEFFCSFRGSLQGAYYSNQMREAESEGRIGHVPYDPKLKVDTWWDLGMNDSTVIIFTQTFGKEIRIIDCYEQNGEGIAHYAKILQDKPYVYGVHHAPHDIEVRELGTGKSRMEIARSLGINFKIVKNISIEDGIEATRSIFSRFWFDANKSKRVCAALRNYTKVFDEINQVYKSHPLHNWASHIADCVRYISVGHQEDRPKREPKEYKPLNLITGY